MEPVTLTTERLVLRPFAPSDAADVHAACQDPDIPRWTPVPSPYSLQEAEHFAGTRTPEGWRQDTEYSFAVCSRQDGFLIGTMGLMRLARLRTPERQAELGYWTAKERRGQGYTVEAARAVARWAFQDLGVERLEWLAEAGNEASRAVARKVGFRMEGTLRAKLVHAGTRRDLWIGSLLPSDLPDPTEPSGTAGATGAPDVPGVPSVPGGTGSEATPYLPYTH
ncbi:GNAT family N-acetyltransferase [Streptomyces pinistramenti]|uniref:GNAT family N-acetyltransferase n=1 Tax=Streptomyces pinistramenti TaxID=2884812 RepID=UPI001D06AA33|nr:GNAT family N-acetyltransferase [Streptomyces pinistramenti]MCB5912057.1 GNAT family N-acetyltransferase [Streptomyces pinistramenti]